MEWFRWHAGTSTDAKLRTIAKRAGARVAEVLAVWATMLEAANEAEERGTLGSWCAEDAATALDLEPEVVEKIAAAMQGKTLDGEKLTGWEKRQPKREDPDATNRKRRSRKRLRERVTDDGNGDVTQGHTSSHNVTTEESRGEERREEQTDRLAQGREARAGGPAREEGTCASDDTTTPDTPAPEKHPSDVPALVAEMEADLSAAAKRAGQKPGRKSLMIVQGEDRTAWADQTGAPVPWPDRPRLLRLALARVEDRESDSLRGALRYVVLQQYDPTERTTAADLAAARGDPRASVPTPPPGVILPPHLLVGPYAGIEQAQRERERREAAEAEAAERRAREAEAIAAWEAEDQVRAARWKREALEAAEQTPHAPRGWIERDGAARYRVRVLEALGLRTPEGESHAA